MRRMINLVAILGPALLMGQLALAQQDAPPLPGPDSTTDHSKLKPLMRDFASGPEVTAACLQCHTEASDQVMHTLHWKWDYANPDTGQRLGKRNVLNAFCGNVAANETRCTSCHAGYGWEDTRVAAPADPTRVDCLVCHDRSGQYTKQDNLAGHPPLDPVSPGAKTITGKDAWAVDLTRAAQSVGLPGRDNCGNCHFFGGGGDNVKHGDLSSALYDPAKEVDVHMSAEGQNFTCATCHVSDRHQVAGSRYNVLAKDTGGTGLPGQRRDVATCESCHSATPHEGALIGAKLNDHTDRVACQTCHIPAFARGGVATKTVWDWSTAGRLEGGKPITLHEYTQSDGKELYTYLSTKGTFEWDENVEPYYAWFNGQVEYTTGLTTIDPAETVEINRIEGSAADPNSRIWPFKQMAGRQPYDRNLDKLVYTHTYGPDTASAFWTNFDWDKSIRAAMDYVGEPYSGEYGFVDTHMYWPITHMVAPADQALDCNACHAKDGRLVNLAGVYVPGANPMGPGGTAGLILLALAAAGVAGHGLLRLIGRKGARHG
jgi:octaheme c-type cytochrome (tetrathionate reductase family)